MAAVDEVVKAGGTEHKIALQEEVPKHRHNNRSDNTRYGETDIVDHVDRIEQCTIIQQVGEILGAKRVEQQATQPH